MADVFLSYAREDRKTAERLAQALERHGCSVWWDRHVPAGKRFDAVIAESLAGARCVVVLWSKAANASEWVGEEAEEARERGLLIPALIEAVEPPLGFRRIQAADLVGWDGDDGHPGLQRLLVDIRNLLGAPPAVRPVASTGGAAAAAVDRRRLRLALGAAAIGLAGVLIAAGLWRLTVTPPAPSAPTGAAGAWVDGRWLGTVVYDWGPTFQESFDFEVFAGVLTGSAGFLGLPRGIEEGKVDGDSVRFVVRWIVSDGSREREAVNHYVGVRSGDGIRMKLSITGSAAPHEPVTFTLERDGK